MASGYSYVLSEAVCEYVFGLPARQQARVATACRSLAENPHRAGDYAATMRDGRVLQNLLIENLVMTYWTDHAVKEVRIIEVAQI